MQNHSHLDSYMLADLSSSTLDEVRGYLSLMSANLAPFVSHPFKSEIQKSGSQLKNVGLFLKQVAQH